MAMPDRRWGPRGSQRRPRARARASRTSVLPVAQDLQQQPGFASPGRVPAEVVSDSPTSTPLRNRVISLSRMLSSIVSWPCWRARLAWWISSRSASVIWVGQTASG